MLHQQKKASDDQKFKELLIFIASRSEGDETYGATKLNKLLFFSDFLAYRRLGQSITNAKYQRLPKGPAPRKLKPVVRELEAANDIVQVKRDSFGYVQERVIARRDADLNVFSAEEIGVVTEVLQRFRGMNATQISDYSHEFAGWQLAEDGEDIPYSTVLVSFEEPSAADRQFAESQRESLAHLAAEAQSRGQS
jgi:hypothetical protein